MVDKGSQVLKSMTGRKQKKESNIKKRETKGTEEANFSDHYLTVSQFCFPILICNLFL